MVRTERGMPSGRVGVVMVNFGEPQAPTTGDVAAYLERIFVHNADLEGHTGAQAKERATQLAASRTPGLLDAHRQIGGSPLNAQADRHARDLLRELKQRVSDVRVYSAFQFTPPFVAEAVGAAQRDGVETLIGLPVYPLCGRSTSVAAIDAILTAITEQEWAPSFAGVTGWHHQPAYASMRAEHVARFAKDRRLDLNAPDTLLYFSAHGTPIKYLDAGNRYDRYVDEHCRDIAGRLGVERYAVGFQNHSARGIPWTQPDNETAIRGIEASCLVVVPISFMHEQSETLVELDIDLMKLCRSLGKELHRVPVPHDDPRFIAFLARLVFQLLAALEDGSSDLRPCTCSGAAGTWCTNGGRNLPPSPYGRSAE